MIRIAMLDDERTALDIAASSIRSLLDLKKIPSQIFTFTDSSIFLDSLKDHQYDLICLDVIMSPLDGTMVAKRIREVDKNVSLVFISSNENKVFSCFEYNPIGFVRKTNFIHDIQAMMEHYLTDILPSLHRTLFLEVRAKGETRLLDIEKIVYIESDRNYLDIHMDDGKMIKVRKLISDLEKELSPYGFLRVHKGFIVNYWFVEKFNASQVTFKTGYTIPLSRGKNDDIIERYLSLTRSSLL